MDVQFSGKYMEMYAVAAWVIDINHFFGNVNIGEKLEEMFQPPVTTPILAV